MTDPILIVKDVLISDVKPYARNPRKNDNSVEMTGCEATIDGGGTFAEVRDDRAGGRSDGETEAEAEG